MMDPQTTARNEPCPCKSGKKYKRCHGVGAAPQFTPPKHSDYPPAGAEGMEDALGKMDPQMVAQVSQSLQKLPKGQLQRLQSMMQKAMNGKDIQSEAEEFEKTLPLEFQELMRNFGSNFSDSSSLTPEMTEEQARALVEKAAGEGSLSQEKAQALLSSPSPERSESTSKLGQFWKNIVRKKEV